MVSTQSQVMELCATYSQKVDANVLHTEQIQATTCIKLASQLHHNSKGKQPSVVMSTKGLLQKHQYIHVLQHDITMASHSLMPIILKEFHDSKGHQGPIHIFETKGRSYWWPKLCQDIVKYINNCNLCAKKFA